MKIDSDFFIYLGLYIKIVKHITNHKSILRISYKFGQHTIPLNVPTFVFHKEQCLFYSLRSMWVTWAIILQQTSSLASP